MEDGDVTEVKEQGRNRVRNQYGDNLQPPSHPHAPVRKASGKR